MHNLGIQVQVHTGTNVYRATRRSTTHNQCGNNLKCYYRSTMSTYTCACEKIHSTNNERIWFNAASITAACNFLMWLVHKRKRSSPNVAVNPRYLYTGRCVVVTATIFMIVSVLIKMSAATDSCARFKVKRSIAVKLEHLDDCYRYHNRRETDGVCKEHSFSNVGRNQNSIMTNIVPYGFWYRY